VSESSAWAVPEHRAWLDEEANTLIDFARPSLRPEGGFYWLDLDGLPDPARPVETWITCRMTYVFALAYLRGDETSAAYVDHGIDAIAGLLRDPDFDGWYSSVDSANEPADSTKAAYPHAFVVLALSAAKLAGRPRAADLLDQALAVVTAHFWDDEAGRTRESYARDWTAEEEYRGANSSMHMVEAFLAAADATGDGRWATRAERIAEHLIHGVAAEADWRLPEHFTPDWAPLREYNADAPEDPFRPYGSTIGHWLEWSRLLLHIETALGDTAPAWLRSDALALFTAAVDRGWAVDGADGFVYTIAWDDKPVVRTRMHWVVAEAIAAAAVLGEQTGDPGFSTWYGTFWDYAECYLIDTEHGGWHHELDPGNRPAPKTWLGKPDVYHAYQATLLPQVPLRPSLARAVIDAAGTQSPSGEPSALEATLD
jgi:mannose/cellobiose epimerase-like protein (N-acyl-D-glucosamine 2-epimerase family)